MEGGSATGSPAKVLFVSANPHQYSQLQSSEELRGIGAGIRKADRSRLQIQHLPAARPGDLLQVLQETPTILHFSGHGASEHGLCFQADNGSVEYVTSTQLAEVLRATRNAIKLVFLNACYSEAQALDLLPHVPCVIGVFGTIGDDAAIAYAREFYSALVDDNSIARAHQRGMVALALRPAHPTRRDVVPSESAGPSGPRLLTRPGVDPDSLYITQPLARRTPGRAASRFFRFLVAVPAEVLIVYFAIHALLGMDASNSPVAVLGPPPESAASSRDIAPPVPRPTESPPPRPASSTQASEGHKSTAASRPDDAHRSVRRPKAPDHAPKAPKLTPIAPIPDQNPGDAPGVPSKPTPEDTEQDPVKPMLEDLRSKDNDRLQRAWANGGE